ncbi:uncharacterized protein LOC129743353 [Uranotaenia lowii]|uniref:uncharacterized protein LOC129743353 n=1 Tax=Uranotaenia lowii TaxID=190385 RepID=UPI002478C472|nr:uncharacterized protein LOC129743353 [Uranotaenia lowii]
MLTASKDQELPKNPFIIGKSVQQLIGKVEDARSINNGTSYVIKVRDAKQAEKLLAMKKLFDDTEVTVSYHRLNFSRCVVTCHDVIDIDEKELSEELRPQGITNVRRIQRTVSGKKVNTATLVLTLSGTVIPEFLYFGLLRVKTRTYYDQPMLCYRCYTYGHTKNRCEKPQLCQNCSNIHEEEECRFPAYCLNCKGNHPANSKKCPIYEFENRVCNVAAENLVSLGEARKMVSAENRPSTYANVSKLQQRLEDVRSNDEILRLRTENQQLKEQLQNFQTLSAEFEAMKLKLASLERRSPISPKPSTASRTTRKTFKNKTPKRKCRISLHTTPLKRLSPSTSGRGNVFTIGNSELTFLSPSAGSDEVEEQLYDIRSTMDTSQPLFSDDGGEH